MIVLFMEPDNIYLGKAGNSFAKSVTFSNLEPFTQILYFVRLMKCSLNTAEANKQHNQLGKRWGHESKAPQ